ncbi:potassium channel family protein [Longispora albida]|uniref:potassium channel family protein n=1 Tax=Longispora albida TaxID=203523 RepID=UPI0003604A21|nr:potassium channel family protein [Longispora albida]
MTDHLDDDDPRSRLSRWESRTGWPATALAVVFLAAYATPILWPGLPDGWHRACDGADLAIWALLGADYLIRLGLARQRLRFVRRHLLDLLVLVLPALRSLRILRLLMVVSLAHRRVQAVTRLRMGVYAGAATGLLVVVASLATLDAERANPDANITTFGDALWWSFTTITTVGYGDQYPTTGQGRFAAVMLIFCGISLLGFITASLASWFVQRFSSAEHAAEETRGDLAELLAEVRQLRAEVTALRSAAEPRN